MTRRRGSDSKGKLWPGIATLLLLAIGSVSSQSASSALNEALPSLEAEGEAIANLSPGSELRKADEALEGPSTRFEGIEEVKKSIESDGESLYKFEGSSNRSQDDPSGVKTDKLRIQETESTTKSEEKRAIDGQPEISENDRAEESPIDYLDHYDDREPTTKPPLRQVGEKKDNSTRKDSKNREDSQHEKDVSLMNDTDVNYKDKKIVKGAKDEVENSTNVGDDTSDDRKNSKGPKDQVETVRNSSLAKMLQRISDASRDKETDVNIKSFDLGQEKSIVESSEQTLKDLTNNDETTTPDAAVNKETVSEIGDDTIREISKSRTISFSGVNDFLEDYNKTGDKSRESIGITDRPILEISTELTRVQTKSITVLKPYPYEKSNHQSNSSNLDTANIVQVSSNTTGEAEKNTIGRNEEQKKSIFVTEASVVIDNSIIQQLKPTDYGRSENISSSTAKYTTESRHEDEGSIETTIEAKTIAFDDSVNKTTVFSDNSPISSNTENDVPRDGATESRVTSKDTSIGGLFDLTGNGITEIFAGIKNETAAISEKSVTTASVQSPSDEISLRITDPAIRGHSESTDAQTDSEDSMLEISSSDVTEGSTRITSTLSTSIPEVSKNWTLRVSAPTASPMIASTLESQEFSGSTRLPLEGSSSQIVSESSESAFFTDPPMTTEMNITSPSPDSSSGDQLVANVSETVSSPSDFPESTTPKIEYVFVGLTESTESDHRSPVASSESPESTEMLSDFGSSSTLSSLSESPGLLKHSTTTAIEDNVDASTETAKVSTEEVASIDETNASEDYSTVIESNVESSTLETSTIWTEGDTKTGETRIEDDDTTTNEFFETTTQEFLATNSTQVSHIVTVDRNPTDEGRSTSVSSTIVPVDASADETITGTTESAVSRTEASTIVPKIIDSTNLDTETSTILPITSTTSTNPVSKTSIPGKTIEDNVYLVPDDSTEITRGANDFPSLVKVVFEGSWIDVCPHLAALRQSLADLLTSGLEKTVLASQIIFETNPCSGSVSASTMASEESSSTVLFLHVVNEMGKFDDEMTKTLPSLYDKSPIKLQVNIRSFQLVQDSDSGNAIAVIVVSCVALICLILLAGLLFIMRKRQTRFNYGERCRPVSLDAYSLDSVSAYNSVRRKGAVRASKRSYGNPTFEDTSAIPSHPLNFSGLSTFCNEQNIISEEFTGIPQVTARIDELPPGAEVKNRYANVVPLPETRVTLMKINNDPLTEYINASYVRGPKNATKYYIACQAPIESTVTDFWRMIWEQQTKVVVMLTDLVENGVEKCAEYIPPSEVTDCHRLYGDFQVTLKKRETKEKYAISTLHLKNLENNTFREISHIWYLWPANGVQSDAAGLIAILLEARALQRGGPGPIVIHCSPGTGRTGTLIALDLGIRQYEITRTVDVPRVVYTIRRDRAGSVQTKEQYSFIYKALNLYATKLAGGALES